MLKSWTKALGFLLLVTMVSALVSCTPTSTPTAEESQPPTTAPQPTEVAATEISSPAEASSPTEAPTAAKKFRVALVLPGSIKDTAWNQYGYEAAMAAKDKYGLELSFQESVPQAEVKDVLRNYAAEGYDLVIAHDLNFTDPVLEVAPDFPNVMFGISGGYMVDGDNVVAVSTTNWESTYLAGTLAGLITETNKIGILTATGDNPIANRMVNSFKVAAQEQNPDVEIIHTYVGSWDDVVKGKELVKSMISQGADVIYTQSGQVNVGAVEAAAEGGVMAIGGVVDMWDVAPDTVVSSALANPGAYVTQLIDMLVEGRLEGGKLYVMGVKDGLEDLAPYHNFEDKISDDVKEKVQEVRQMLVDGKVPTPSEEQ
ncbi:MAG: BMP family ABC transporter substrate-binding protein [Chloroflexi bacterium]|nr:BMP family ABC transporter substrate-binding protein [Chloroflexota bacterium]